MAADRAIQKKRKEARSKEYEKMEEARLEELISRAKAKEEMAMQIILKHVNTLATKRRQLVVRDSYGNEDAKKWDVEKSYFCDNVLLKANSHLDFGMMNSLIENAVSTQLREDEIAGRKLPAGDISPNEYEHWCAGVLKNNGWETVVTKCSGDQGIDIVATMNGIKVVVQCKKYECPVGNSAVQEVIAGKQFEDAEHAVVVTNATFTTSARNLANKCDVLLLHDSELDQLYERLPKQ